MGAEGDTVEELVISSTRARYAEVESLLAKDDPPETPFESKYKAREILRDLLDGSALKDHPSGDALAVNLLARLGAVDHEVEELHESQVDLERALKLADGKEKDGLYVMPVLVCLNQLGILWCTRGEFDKSKEYLFRSLDTYRAFKSAQRQEEASESGVSDVHDLLQSPEEERSSETKKTKNIDLLNTHTYYFLAQVHEKIGQADKAGEFCHITLRRQLDLGEYKPLDWATNAYTLSHHYLVADRFSLAKHHIGAARAVLEKYRKDVASKMEEDEELRESVNKTSAGIHRAMGRYSLVLLQKSRERLGDKSDGDNAEGLEETHILDREQDDAQKRFPGLEIDPELDKVPHRLATDFDSAREIFLPGQRAVNASKEEHFTLNDHCTDFVEASRDLSAMLKALAAFEEDPGRRFKIHKRRAAALEEPLNAMSRQMYLLVCRQLMFELAEIHESMMDAKLDGGGEKGGVSYAKVNAVVDRAVHYFDEYLSSLNDSSTGEAPKKFPAESVRPALSAHFHLARLWDKYLVSDKPEGAASAARTKLRNKIFVLDHFRAIVDYCERNPDSESVVAAELPLCREMARLLPIKIAKMKAEAELLEANQELNKAEQDLGKLST